MAGNVADHISDPFQRASAINSVRQTLLAAAAGVATLLGLTVTLNTYLLARRTQFSERYVKAVTLLAADGLDERVGGIYALEQLAGDSIVDSEAVTNVLLAFVRRRAGKFVAEQPQSESPSLLKLSSSRRSDVQAALTVLGRARTRHSTPLDFSSLELASASLRNADLKGANFSSTVLRGADLSGAQLRGSDLSGADLTRAILTYSDLRGADMTGATLDHIKADGADLRGCVFTATKMRRASLIGARFTAADLACADTQEQ